MDSTPRPGHSEPNRPASVPPWVLVLILVAFILGMAWIMLTFGGGQAL
jgi:hypothetical protein